MSLRMMRRGVAGDVQAGLEAVLQAHARHGFGGDAVPGRLGLEERLGSSDLARDRRPVPGWPGR